MRNVERAMLIEGLPSECCWYLLLSFLMCATSSVLAASLGPTVHRLYLRKGFLGYTVSSPKSFRALLSFQEKHKASVITGGGVRAHRTPVQHLKYVQYGTLSRSLNWLRRFTPLTWTAFIQTLSAAQNTLPSRFDRV